MKSAFTIIAAVLALSAGTAFAQSTPTKVATAHAGNPAPAKVTPAPATTSASVPLDTVVRPAVEPGVIELPQVHAVPPAPKAVGAKDKGHQHGDKHHQHGDKHHRHADTPHRPAK